MNAPDPGSPAYADTTEISDLAQLPAKPVISVYMLAYRHEHFIAEAIDGVIAQQCNFPIELIIGEDCSPDRTREIALDYQRRHPQLVRVLTSEKNVGASANARRCQLACRGSLTAFCEGDDYWTDPLKLQLQADYLREHPDAGAVHSDFDHVLFRSGGYRTMRSFQRRTRERIPQGDIFPQLLSGNFIQTCTLCVRTELVRDYRSSGLSIDRYPVGDWPLCLYISARTRIGYLNRSTAVYRKVPGSAMNSGDLARLQLVTKYKIIIDDICDHFHVDPASKDSAYTSLNYQLLKLAFLANDNPAFENSYLWLQGSAPTFHSRQRELLHFAMRMNAIRRLLGWLIVLRRRLNETSRYRSLR